jgi:hypothetical protein
LSFLPSARTETTTIILSLSCHVVLTSTDFETSASTVMLVDI